MVAGPTIVSGKRRARPSESKQKSPTKSVEAYAGGENDEQRKTSRICMKQLPHALSESSKLKAFLFKSKESYFSEVPFVITDCKVLEKRRMAFVGFSSQDAAEACVKFLHKSFYRTSRLVVEFALPPKEKSPSTEAAKEDPNDEVPKKEKETDPMESQKQAKSDARKEEFLSVMGASASKKSNSRVWSNDDGIEPEAATTGSEPPAKEMKDSDEESSSESDGSESDEDVADPLGVATPAGSKKQSDMDFLRSKTTSIQDFDSDNDDAMEDAKSENSSASEPENENVPMKDNEPEKDDDGIATSVAQHLPTNYESLSNDGTDQKRLFVRNIAFDTLEEDLKAHFSTFGTVEECHVPVDDHHRGKGFAFVAFSTAEAASNARSETDGTDFQGRLIHVLQAKRAPTKTPLDNSNMSYKEEQDHNRRQQSLKDQTGSSASFVRGDAVVDNLAARLGLKKGDILSVKDGMSGGDAAVRLALGETAIIEENRSYFADHGIDMEALVSFSTNSSKTKQERSKTALLVKNLPHDTTAEELQKTFSLPGTKPSRILLPPSHTVAVVEYEHANVAKKSFKQLAYRKFKSVPLYLEFAPVSSFDKGRSVDNLDAIESKKQSVDDDDGNDNTDEHTGPTFTVYVKNLNFSTTEADLWAAFEEFSIRAVRIPMKVAPTKRNATDDGASSQQSMSMGYGFVEFKSQESAKLAVKTLQGKILAGHALELAISKGASRDSTPQIPARPPSKLMVRNVPFQATRKELLQLFGSFGQLKRVRLPKKFDGNHRGFAFLEFVSGKEAAAAMKALSRTHLYGRHLVLEWAETSDESVQGLREKTQKQQESAAAPKNKKIRFE